MTTQFPDLDLAKQLIDEANTLISERDRKLHDANVLRNAIRHWGAKERFTRPRQRLLDDVQAAQEEIDFKLAMAEDIIERSKES